MLYIRSSEPIHLKTGSISFINLRAYFSSFILTLSAPYIPVINYTSKFTKIYL